MEKSDLSLYRVENSYGWSWYDFKVIDEVFNHLKNCGIEEISQKEGKLQTPFGGSLSDAEILIYDKKKDILRGFSFAEDYNEVGHIFNKRNNENDILATTHIHCFSNVSPNRKYKLKPFVYGPFDWTFDYNSIYQEKKTKTELINKMCFFESSKNRHLVYMDGGLQDHPNEFEGGTLAETMEGYLRKTISYKVGLQIPGVGEINHRLFDYFACGQPVMCLDFLSELDNPLIPNHHYISVSREKWGFPKDVNMDRMGGELYVRAYIERFNEVKNDLDFLNFIGENGRNYHEENVLADQTLRILKILEL